MTMNIIVQLVAALVPTVVGFIWYNPKVFGKVWMNASGLTEDSMKGANMAVIFGASLALSFFLGFALNFMVIHQNHVFSTVQGVVGLDDPASSVNQMLNSFMAEYGENFRTFKHGALHGALGGFTVALPIVGTNALFERKSFKYIAVNAGYWIVTMAIMGGIICQFS